MEKSANKIPDGLRGADKRQGNLREEGKPELREEEERRKGPLSPEKGRRGGNDS